ncbi:MAG TPA: SCO family protein [Steroidobacteraceae bacterium]|nr:SCO family protein [Steroidobacteraceae bacterium]
MRNISRADNNRFAILTLGAAAMAAVALIFVWGPLQIRAFDQATLLARLGTGTAIAAGAALAADSDAAPSTATSWTHVPFVTSEGTPTSIAATDGRVRIVTMMYTHCPGSCPLALATLRRIEGNLTPRERSRLSVIALSLDPEKDTVASLNAFRQTSVVSPAWILGRPSASDVPVLARALGVSYRIVGDGYVDHQSAFVILDAHGRVLSRTGRTQDADPSFTVELRRALAAN